MARPKGIEQKRNESKYILPEGVTLKENQTLKFTKETKLVFIDQEFGEFSSTFKAIINAGASTHPKSVQRRREITNIIIYGGTNPSNSKEVREKASNTMLERYGVKNALENPELLRKSRETLMKNHGISHPMELEEFRNRQKETSMKNHGVSNPMKSEKIKEQLRKSNLSKYGVDNPGKLPTFKEKALASMVQNNGHKASSGELEVKEYIQSLGLECESSYIGGANPKEIDIKIKELGIAIEYNGLYWHSEAIKQIYPRYHIDKTIAAKNSGLDLIHIFEHEWLNRKEQVKSFLKSKVGKNSTKYYARKLILKEVSFQEASDFLEKYHILGKTMFTTAIGLYNKDELLCMITVGKHHRGKDEWVLSRFITKEDINVCGGLSKLTKYAVLKYGDLYTWVDLRWSNGDNWIKSGWNLVKTLKPDYFYYHKKTGQIISKQARQKKRIGTPSEMTEHQHALKDGLLRIYDCGKIKLRFKCQK